MPKNSMILRIVLLIVFSAMITTAGCSKADKNDSTSPSINSIGSSDEIVIPPSYRTGQLSYEGIIGLFNLRINTEEPYAELIPVRGSSALGDSYQVDITYFLSLSPCSDCVRIKSIEMESDRTITLHIAARHPFPLPQDPDNPLNNERLDLHVFDVEGILITEGDLVFPATRSDFDGDGYPEEQVVGSSCILTNADGYTSILDTFYDTILPTVATIHPYKIFAYDPSQGNYNPALDPTNGYPYLGNPTGYNVFPQGSPEYSVEYNLNLPPGPTVNFLFAMSASWGQGAKGRGSEVGKRNNPRYFLPEFNRKEPYKVSVSVTSNTLAGNTPASNARLTIQILDWQHNGTVEPNFDFFTTSLTRLIRKSDINEVTVEIPAMGIWFDEGNLPTPTGNGTATNPYTYTMQIYNSALVPGGRYYGLAAARDDLWGQNLEMGIQRDGVTLFRMQDFATYLIFPIDVGSADNPPTACITTDPTPAQVTESEQPIVFDGTCSTDDGTIVNYEWDFDYTGNPAQFRPDAVLIGPIVSKTYARPGFYLAALRVTDNHVPSQQDVTSVPVSIFCTQYPPTGCTIDQVFSYMTTSNNNWEERDGKIDFGFLSDGRVVMEDDEVLGTSAVTPMGNANFVPFVSPYPAVNVGSIDVDRRNRVIWVEYDGPDSVIIGDLDTKISRMDNRILVFDTNSNTEIASVSLAQYGTHIQAVDTDVEDNVWVLMNHSKLIRLRASDYVPVPTNLYDLDEIAGSDIGPVFDFAINFHSDTFFFLTQSNDKGALWRFECDLSFLPMIKGHPNPLDAVFDMVGGLSMIALFGDDALADIEIDNFSGPGYGTVLDGQQDCQIAMIACGLMVTTQINASRTIASADLIALKRELSSVGFGTHAMGIKPDGSNLVYSIVYGNDPYIPPGCSDKEMDIYLPPAGWQ